ncbi:DUF4291 family protein [Streptomyces phaeochromogenes]|uniref:DUF4291 family protein n=1 Tax=Streptomyces phaeochromogenes TaxID=1923 RepID=UPI003711AB98
MKSDAGLQQLFEWALRHAILSSYVRGVHPDRANRQLQVKQARARVRWNPERDPHLRIPTCPAAEAGPPAAVFPVRSGWRRYQGSGVSPEVTLRLFRPRPK